MVRSLARCVRSLALAHSFARSFFSPGRRPKFDDKRLDFIELNELLTRNLERNRDDRLRRNSEQASWRTAGLLDRRTSHCGSMKLIRPFLPAARAYKRGEAIDSSRILVGAVLPARWRSGMRVPRILGLRGQCTDDRRVEQAKSSLLRTNLNQSSPTLESELVGASECPYSDQLGEIHSSDLELGGNQKFGSF